MVWFFGGRADHRNRSIDRNLRDLKKRFARNREAGLRADLQKRRFARNGSLDLRADLQNGDLPVTVRRILRADLQKRGFARKGRFYGQICKNGDLPEP